MSENRRIFVIVGWLVCCPTQEEGVGAGAAPSSCPWLTTGEVEDARARVPPANPPSLPISRWMAPLVGGLKGEEEGEEESPSLLSPQELPRQLLMAPTPITALSPQQGHPHFLDSPEEWLTTAGSLGASPWTSYSQSSALLWTWPMFGDSLFSATGMEEVPSFCPTS
ncbi:hypothetical protein SK128_024575 [Halocaridina rubra]|uniref:Uncharacterized protein n=1 Tax=Halocaridina rubra TaxID=373956 RepID=A0AAN8WHW6_HALRR